MPKIRKKSPIHENADANITCDFGDGDISHFRSRLYICERIPHRAPYYTTERVSKVSFIYMRGISIYSYKVCTRARVVLCYPTHVSLPGATILADGYMTRGSVRVNGMNGTMKS